MSADPIPVRPSAILSALIIFRQVWQYRWQLWVDFRKDLFAPHRGSLGQSLWIVVLPCVPLSVYMLLGTLRVFPTRSGMDGVAYVIVGATLWYLMAGLTTGAMSALSSKGKSAVQDSYPLVAVLASANVQQVFDFSVRVLVSLAILLFVQPPNVVGALLFIPALVPAALLFVGLGLIFGIFSVAIVDLYRLLPILLQYAFFLSLVLFPLPEIGIIPSLLTANPFAVFIDNIRHLLLLGTLSNAAAYAVWSVLSALVFLWALRFYFASHARIAGHL